MKEVDEEFLEKFEADEMILSLSLTTRDGRNQKSCHAKIFSNNF